MLTQLSTVKTRLGIPELDTTNDALLTQAIAAVSRRFDLECHRSFERTVNAAYEFGADALELCVPCYPIESVSRFDLKSNESAGWAAQQDIEYIVRQTCVISLAAPLGNWRQQGRVTYTGGYVPPGVSAEPGQVPLPADVEGAAVDQVVFWFQNRDRLGLHRLWEYHGTYRQFVDLDLLTPVRAVLARYERRIL